MPLLIAEIADVLIFGKLVAGWRLFGSHVASVNRLLQLFHRWVDDPSSRRLTSASDEPCGARGLASS